MPPIEVDGLLRPDLDARWVPVSTMALYESVSTATVYTRMLDGFYPEAGVRAFGNDRRYLPKVCFASRQAQPEQGVA